MEYEVRIIHIFKVEANNEEEAIDKAMEMSYSEANDCQIEVE